MTQQQRHNALAHAIYRRGVRGMDPFPRLPRKTKKAVAAGLRAVMLPMREQRRVKRRHDLVLGHGGGGYYGLRRRIKPRHA